MTNIKETTYSLIGSIIYFDNKSKIHIALDDTVNTICGKHLGFAYEPHTQYGEIVKYTFDELLTKSDICKSCIKSLQKRGLNDKSQLNK